MDFSKYINIPYVKGGRDIDNPDNGLDCWGLVVLFYKNEFNVILPTYDDISTANRGVGEVSGDLMLTDTYKHFKSTPTSKPADLILLRIGAHPIHIGIVKDNRMMLHATDGGSVIETYKGIKWQQRIHSFVRWEGNI
jgi:cell wall-associated NlpC family hydrolase